MSDDPDFRVSAGVFDHPKWLRLEAELGCQGLIALLRFWGFLRRHRTSGDLAGLTDAEIDRACRWTPSAGAPAGALTRTLAQCGFIDGDETRRSAHGWQEHNGWASASGARTLSGRVAAMVKQCRRTGMEPDTYLDAQGGALAVDTSLRTALREAYAKGGGKRVSKRRKSARTATAPATAVNPQVPLTVSDPVPDPTGREGSGDDSAPDLPVVGSVATSKKERRADWSSPPPVTVCVQCRSNPPAFGRAICAACITPVARTPACSPPRPTVLTRKRPGMPVRNGEEEA